MRTHTTGQGVFGMSHLRYRPGLLRRDPDDWSKMTPGAKAAIERDTLGMLRRVLGS